MRIAIEQAYRGRLLPAGVEAGEHEVPDAVGEYLLATHSGAPFYAKRVDKEQAEAPAESKTEEPTVAEQAADAEEQSSQPESDEKEPEAAVETKPAFPPEVKPSLPPEPPRMHLRHSPPQRRDSR